MDLERADASCLVTDHHKLHWQRLTAATPYWDSAGLRLDDTYVMYYAEAALMNRHAELLCGVRHPRVLDVGVGLGVFANAIIAVGPDSYTGIELHPEIAEWVDQDLKQRWPRQNIRILNGAWQECLNDEAQYDCIMYDTWPPEGKADDDFSLFLVRVVKQQLTRQGRLSFFCSGIPSEHRLGLLERHFEHVHQEQYRVHPLPNEWSKPNGNCTICVAMVPKSGGA